MTFDEDGNVISSWPKPRPISRGAPRPLPLDVLPAWWAQWIREEAEDKQVDPVMPFGFSLGALAALLGGRVWVQGREGWREGCNLYVAVIANPGERKSPVQRHASEPVRAYEREMIAAAQPEITRLQLALDTAELEHDRAREAVRKAKKPEERNAAREALAEAKAALDACDPPIEPRIVVGDCTPEKVIELLARHGGRLALLADEDSLMGHLCGRYSKSPAIEPFLTAYSNEAIAYDRKSSPLPIRCERPALTISVPMQPAVITGARGNAAILDRGLLDRFIVLVPESRVGWRAVDTTPTTEVTRVEYSEAMLAIARAFEHEEVTLTLTPEAGRRFLDWAAEHEPRMRDGRPLASIRGWAAKCGGRCLRLAALLHAGHCGWADTRISGEAMRGATAIMDCLADHALAMFDLLEADQALTDARRVARWIDREERAELSTRDVERVLAAKADRARECLAVLDDHGYVRQREKASTSRGGRPSERWEVSPRIGEVLSVLSRVA